MDASDSTTQAKPEAPGLLDDWLTRKQLAEQLEVSVDTLSRWETMRKGPPCVLAGRRVLYRKGAVQEWLLEQEQRKKGGRR